MAPGSSVAATSAGVRVYQHWFAMADRPKVLTCTVLTCTAIFLPSESCPVNSNHPVRYRLRTD